MRPFNLLSHPGQAQQRKVFHRCWSSVAGLLVGCLLAWLGQQWQKAETLRLQQANSQLQSAWLARTQQAQAAAQQQTRQRVQMAQAALLQKIALHQQAWMSVHERLLDMAEEGLRLSRMQSDADHVTWHGAFKRFEDMAVARQNLSEQWGLAVSLKDLSTGPASQVRFVWESTWPVLQGVRLGQAGGVEKAKP